MATRILGDMGFAPLASRTPAGRPAVGSRVEKARRSVNAWLLSLDDSTLATFGFDRLALEETGRGPFPL
jgi:hypothetical protein